MSIKEARVLQVAYKFPPIKSIGAVRNYSVAMALREHAAAHYVITTRNRSFMPAQELPHYATLDIYPVRTFDYRTLLHALGSKQGFSGNLAERAFVSLVARLKDSFPFNIIIDEGSLIYIWSAYRAGVRLVEREGITHLYSSFRPYADHIVAHLLKRRFPHLVWMADFRDPHVDLNRKNVWWPRAQQRYNRRILSRADVVVTVSKGLAAYFERYGRPVLVLRNGINPGLYPTPAHQRGGRFRITYTGSIYADQQSAVPLMRVLAAMIREGLLREQDIALRYAGKDKALWDAWADNCGLAGVNDSRGSVSMEESLAMQHNSELNLLLSWSGPHIQGILTGKLFEYLAARRPILAVVKGSVDPEFEEIFEETGAGLAVFTEHFDREAVRRFIMERYAAWQRGEDEFEYKEAAMEAFTWPYAMPRFLESVTALTQCNQRRGRLLP